MTLDEEESDGPDIVTAKLAYTEAQQGQIRTDRIVKDARRQIGILRLMHDENHFVEKLRMAIRGAA